MRIAKSVGVLLVILPLALALGACGSNLGSSDAERDDGGGVERAAAVGIGNCATCHSGGAVAVWLTGVHGNPERLPTTSLSDPACLVCHDALGDGQELASAVPGQNARPVVGCESCHGGGQLHQGMGPLPAPEPGVDRCGQCHDDSYPHASPEGDHIAESFRDSPHTRSLNDHVFADDGMKTIRARCAKCHSDEGARRFLDVDGSYSELTAALPNAAAPVVDADAIGCGTCHQPHREDRLLEDASQGRSAEFNTCTNCHQLVDEFGDKIVGYHDPEANSHGNLGEIITDTHFATPGFFDPAARGQNQNDITGYAMDFFDERACRNCHNPHDADTTLNEQWAESKHADRTAAGAWAHYNWTEPDRADCQRCHTTRGLIRLVAQTDGDTRDYVPFTDYDPGYAPEMLHCNGCHSDNLGGLRSLGAVTVDYTDAPTTYPDAEGSNLCISCHTGRESGQSIQNSTDDFSNKRFVNSHYLTAGGIVYGRSGYEYAGQDYADVDFFAHDAIGTGAEPGTGTEGACIGCHLSGEQSHTFLPIVRDEETGEITQITAPVCAECHSGQYALTPVELNEEQEHLHDALLALEAQLVAQGFPFLGGYPYFSNTDWTAGGAFDGKQAMGAAFNFNLLEHDPGAYAHNRFYAKRLIYDSIDYMDNAALDGSVGAALDALVTAGDLDAPIAAAAKTYLDGDDAAGVQRP